MPPVSVFINCRRWSCFLNLCPKKDSPTMIPNGFFLNSLTLNGELRLNSVAGSNLTWSPSSGVGVGAFLDFGFGTKHRLLMSLGCLLSNFWPGSRVSSPKLIDVLVSFPRPTTEIEVTRLWRTIFCLVTGRFALPFLPFLPISQTDVPRKKLLFLF